MKTDWNEFIQLAHELIGENSRTVEFVRLRTMPIDPAKPWLGSAEAEEIRKVEAVFVPIGSGLGHNVATEEMLNRVDKVCMVAATFYIHDTHKIRDDGSIYRIEWKQELRPGDKLILTYLGVKR